MDQLTAPVPCFVELCAGSAAVTLSLLRDGALPPVSYKGGKRAYAKAILGALRLSPGAGAKRVVLVESGPWAEVWRAISERRTRDGVVSLLRSWDREDPRQLWERLAGAAEGSRSEAAASWLIRGCWSYEAGNPGSGFAQSRAYETIWQTAEEIRIRRTVTPLKVALAVEALGSLPWASVSVVRSDVLAVDPAGLGLPPGSLVYLDPPYAGTSQYSATLSRREVLRTAWRWARAGATVCASEAEPLALGAGWRSVEITGERTRVGSGAGRTFSVQQSEYLTLNRA